MVWYVECIRNNIPGVTISLPSVRQLLRRQSVTGWYGGRRPQDRHHCSQFCSSISEISLMTISFPCTYIVSWLCNIAPSWLWTLLLCHETNCQRHERDKTAIEKEMKQVTEWMASHCNSKTELFFANKAVKPDESL